MKELFEYIRDNVLHGMPAGCLVTKNEINFDIGMWQHKTYEHSNQIYEYLRSKWTPHTINLMILDDICTTENIIKFQNDNSFEFKWRSIYFIYCIAMKSDKVTPEICHLLKTQKYFMNTYHQKVLYKEYTIFVCDLVQNLLYY